MKKNTSCYCKYRVGLLLQACATAPIDGGGNYCCWCCSLVLVLLWSGCTHAHKNFAPVLWVGDEGMYRDAGCAGPDFQPSQADSYVRHFYLFQFKLFVLRQLFVFSTRNAGESVVRFSELVPAPPPEVARGKILRSTFFHRSIFFFFKDCVFPINSIEYNSKALPSAK